MNEHDPSAMPIDDVIDRILMIVPPPPGGRSHAEANLQALDREDLDRLYRSLLGVWIRHNEGAKAALARYQERSSSRPAARAKMISGMKRLRLASEAIRDAKRMEDR